MHDMSRLIPDPVQALAAIQTVQAMIAFQPDGTILGANDLFLRLMGYSEQDIIGLGHRIFLRPGEESQPWYTEFWERLRRGEPQQGEFCRQAKSGEIVWISAAYTPIRDRSGQVERIVKFAFDITAAKRLAAQAEGQITALGRSQAVIEFSPTGKILSANENFLSATGYSRAEIEGREHRMFLPAHEAGGAEYRAFWEALRRGEPQAGEFQRIGRDGRPVWLVASYNPVRDERGRVLRVVKYATDVTLQKVAVNRLVEGLSNLAHGDLTARLGTEVGGEFAAVRETFNNMITELGAMIGQIRDATQQMREQAHDIRTGAHDLANRGERQASSVERTATSVTRIVENVRMTSETAGAANAVASAAQDRAQRGAGVVSQAVNAMERIESHTRQMSEITRVIENFAFQTNLLSINAAVEAARAGEVGRGFAVVASEVRNLAQQSAKASQSIADLIDKSATDVKEGVSLVRGAGSALTEINDAVAQMVKSIADIARATTEQSNGVSEVSGALHQIDTVTHQNMALSEQYAGSARALSEQLDTIAGLMEGFRLEQPASARPLGRVA